MTHKVQIMTSIKIMKARDESLWIMNLVVVEFEWNLSNERVNEIWIEVIKNLSGRQHKSDRKS